MLKKYRGIYLLIIATSNVVVAESDIDRVEKISNMVDKFIYQYMQASNTVC